jgi:hypothetical protein
MQALEVYENWDSPPLMVLRTLPEVVEYYDQIARSMGCEQLAVTYVYTDGDTREIVLFNTGHILAMGEKTSVQARLIFEDPQDKDSGCIRMVGEASYHDSRSAPCDWVLRMEWLRTIGTAPLQEWAPIVEFLFNKIMDLEIEHVHKSLIRQPEPNR